MRITGVDLLTLDIHASVIALASALGGGWTDDTKALQISAH